nr:MAG TPA: hypothetical protein [Inoviridae sp.]
MPALAAFSEGRKRCNENGLTGKNGGLGRISPRLAAPARRTLHQTTI